MSLPRCRYAVYFFFIFFFGIANSILFFRPRAGKFPAIHHADLLPESVRQVRELSSAKKREKEKHRADVPAIKIRNLPFIFVLFLFVFFFFVLLPLLRSSIYLVRANSRSSPLRRNCLRAVTSNPFECARVNKKKSIYIYTIKRPSRTKN